MKNIIFTFVLLIVYVTTFAQNTSESEEASSKYEVLTNRFGNNWFISANGGAQVLFGDYDKKGGFKNRIAPAIDIAVGKWFTPGLGLRLTYSGLQVKGYSNIPTAYTKNGIEDGLYKEKWNLMNLHGDVLFNLTNMFCGYEKNRVYNAIPYLGFGLLHAYDGMKKNNFGVMAGFLNTFRLSGAWDFNIEARALITNDNFDLTPGKSKMEWLLSLTAGFTYKFSPRTFRRPAKREKVVSSKQLITASELEDIRTRLIVLGAENENLKSELENTLKKKETAINKPIEKSSGKSAAIAPRAVFFSLGSAEISPQEIVNLGFQADQMKEHPELRYIVTGFADAATGSAEINKKISLRRAEAVINALVNTYGINRAYMRAEAFGGSAKFEKAYLNRTVIITAE